MIKLIKVVNSTVERLVKLEVFQKNYKKWETKSVLSTSMVFNFYS